MLPSTESPVVYSGFHVSDNTAETKELPENLNLSRQVNEALPGRVITGVFNAIKPHKFTFFYGDPLSYGRLLTGRRIESSGSFGMFVDLSLDGDARISCGEGTNLRHSSVPGAMPGNYQLLLSLDDNTYLVFTVGMYGAIAAYRGAFDNPYYQKARDSPSPLSDEFNETYFETLFSGLRPKLPVKMLLAAEQRIPGLGNGVLQDILFQAKIHPKRPIASLTDPEKSALLHAVKDTLNSMTVQGGRDTETDLFGHPGGYKTLLSKNTLGTPCPRCAEPIIKEIFNGGAVYYCPGCQKI